ncbi:hypothetical protein Ddc_14948 [Ditylenchus destructor]|nr:hypothetical protein Ddc_14948 [Ditylenchus destructor]
MTQTPFFCNVCRMDLDEWNVRNHISAMHLNYFPFKCFACKTKGVNHETLSAELMYEHTSTVHQGTVMDVRLFMDREDELNAAVENCRRPSPEQVPPNDSKQCLRQVFISLGETLTDTRDDAQDDAIENEVTSTEIKQEVINMEVHKSTNNDNIGVNTESDSLIPLVTSTEPTAVGTETVETQQNATDPITSPANTLTLSAMPLAKPESPKNISTVPAQHNSDAIATGSRKRNNVSSNLVVNPERSATSQLHEPSISCKKRSRIELDNVSQLEANAFERMKQRALLINKRAAGPTTEVSTVSVQRSSVMNQSSPNIPSGDKSENDRFRKPTTSAQSVLNVPNDPAQKKKIAKIKIKKIWIDISSGSASFETSASLKFDSRRDRPLCKYVPILRHSEADLLGCVAYISYVSYKWHDREILRKKLETFSQEIHSIAHLWANGRVVAELNEYPQHENVILPVSDFCDKLFSQDRSILACNQLEIKLADSWPFSVVTNAARRCNQIILMEKRLDHRLHYKLLDALYEMKMPQHVEVTLGLKCKTSTNEFMDELKKRFQRSEQNFKLTLLFPHWIAFCREKHFIMRLWNKHGLILRTTIQKEDSHEEDRACVMIEQRSSS